MGSGAKRRQGQSELSEPARLARKDAIDALLSLGHSVFPSLRQGMQSRPRKEWQVRTRGVDAHTPARPLTHWHDVVSAIAAGFGRCHRRAPKKPPFRLNVATDTEVQIIACRRVFLSPRRRPTTSRYLDLRCWPGLRVIFSGRQQREWGGRWLWASHATWSAPRRAFMYWHRSTMARPSKMVMPSCQHKCPSFGITGRGSLHAYRQSPIKRAPPTGARVGSARAIWRWWWVSCRHRAAMAHREEERGDELRSGRAQLR